MNTTMGISALAAAALAATLLTGAVTPVADVPRAAASRIAPDRELGEKIVPVTLSIVGDSITAWNPPYKKDPAQSWVTSLGGDMVRIGGWAEPGAKLDEMLANVTRSDASIALIMGGTNDVFYGTPIAARLETIDRIAHTLSAEVTVLSSVAPFGLNPAASEQWNAALRAHATERGWVFIDPWKIVRTSSGDWTPGASLPDTVHPTPATAAAIGPQIRRSLSAVWSLLHKEGF
jgi:acyl-CoA thioesterase-1